MTSPRRHSKRSPSMVVAPLPFTAAYILLAVVRYGAVLIFGASRIMCSPMVSMAGLPSSTSLPNWPRGGAEAFERFAQRKHERRILGRRRLLEGFVGRVLLGRLEEHRLEQLHQRHVEEIEPIG